ncbi:MAG: hypothetical protein L6R41_004954 [Letrouitia leprolyta]|nr:MAG: hypothetical protein L6R41_004954 [Letrouitia leprolyta]
MILTTSRLLRQDDELPGCLVNYLHPDYLTAFDPNGSHNGRSWSTWLEELAGVHHMPRLCSSGQKLLSSEFQHLVGYRSDKLLETLKQGWNEFRQEINEDLQEELQNSSVILEDGERAPLSETFRPNPNPKKIAIECGIDAAFPFIALSNPLKVDEKSDWTFVEKLDVGVTNDLYFYLAALYAFKSVSPGPQSSTEKDQLSIVYRGIQS